LGRRSLPGEWMAFDAPWRRPGPVAAAAGALSPLRCRAYPELASGKRNPQEPSRGKHDHPASARTRAVPAGARPGSHAAGPVPPRTAESRSHAPAARPASGARSRTSAAAPGPHPQLSWPPDCPAPSNMWRANGPGMLESRRPRTICVRAQTGGRVPALKYPISATFKIFLLPESHAG